tara:strand:- start:120 stop:1088 length:969 start_codon:yes stop_codon:yes gene_type:complete
MSEHSEIEKENRNESVSQEISQNTNGELDSYEFNDNRIESYQLKNLQMKADNSLKTSQLKVFQFKANNTLQFADPEEEFSREEERGTMNESTLKDSLDNAFVLVAEINQLIDGAASAKVWNERLKKIRTLSITVGIGLTAIGIGVVTGGAGWLGILGYFAALSVAEAAGLTAGIGAGFAIGEAVSENQRGKEMKKYEENKRIREGGEKESELPDLSVLSDTAISGGSAAAAEAGKKLLALGLSSTGIALGGLAVLNEGVDLAKDISWEHLDDNAKQIVRNDIDKIGIGVKDAFDSFPPSLEEKYGPTIKALDMSLNDLKAKL